MLRLEVESKKDRKHILRGYINYVIFTSSASDLLVLLIGSLLEGKN